ncbi:MAG: DUF1302 domain-containing protein [Pseudomonas sp.]|uniref:DUF1302 domain-containing protein n=1 Tax=Pseudomonas sp. TaxID=306 RepID=UPI003BB7F791
MSSFYSPVFRTLCSRPLARLLLSLPCSLAAPAWAVPFNIGGLEANLDSRLALEVDWAMSAPDSDLIGTRNGGTAAAQTGDDGRLNFARGDAFSKRFDGWHGLELRQGDSGLFVRGHYWYDFGLMEQSLPLYDIDNHGRQPGAQASGGEILEAYGYHNYQLDGPEGELAGNLRGGKQLLRWGESHLLENPLNSINPLDRQALQRPAMPIEDGALPVNLLHLGQQLTPSLSAELFYQLDWQAEVQSNCGTYFAASDVQAQGCDTRLAVAGSDFAPQAAAGYRYVPRLPDQEARDSGQYGVALHWQIEELGGSELGLYALNYHSRAAFFSTQVGQPVGQVDPLSGATSAQYQMGYPEDIRQYGLSIARERGGTRLFAQLSHSPNMPLQINGADLTLVALDPTAMAGNPLFSSGYANAAAGSQLRGYQRHPMTQLQLGVTQVVEQVLGAEQLKLQAEVGGAHLNGVADSQLRFGRDGLYGLGQLPDNSQCGSLNPQGDQACNEQGFYTEQSWGWRARASLDYADVWPGLNLSPNLALAQDVHGYGPQFNQGSKALGVGLAAEFQNSYNASLSYNSFFGGAYNPRSDRDFMALSLGLNF